MGESNRSRERWERGNAMLELVLLLPTYVLLIYIVMTLGEYGQVATSLYNAGRNVAWTASGATSFPSAASRRGTVQSTFFDHFGPRVSVAAGGWTPVPLGYDGERDNGVAMPRNGVLTLRGATGFDFRNHADPLPGACGYYMSQLEADEPRPNLERRVRLALEGDESAGGAPGQAIPWLRRQYAAVEAKYKPIGEIVSPYTFRTWHTVLRFQTWNSSSHAPYGNLSGHPGSLRDVEAYRTPESEGVAQPRSRLHQMEMLDMSDLRPERPQE